MDSKNACRRGLPIAAMLLLSTWTTSPASGVEIALHERSVVTDDLHTCGVEITASDTMIWVDGLGVDGGVSGGTIDTAEWVEFDLDAPQPGFYFDVDVADDNDGDGVAGRAIVEAFDAGGASLGIHMIQGTGRKDVASMVGGATVSRVVATALADGLRIDRVGYDETGPVEMDLLNGGYLDTFVTSPTVCGVRVVGSSQVYYSDSAFGGTPGMGVSGVTLDGSEWMRLEFPYPVDELVLESLLYGVDGDFLYGEAVLFAYDEAGGGLGSMSLSRHSLFGGPLSQTVDVADALGVGGIAEIEIFSLGDARRLDRVVYAPEPEVGAGVAVLAAAAFAARRARVRGGRSLRAGRGDH